MTENHEPHVGGAQNFRGDSHQDDDESFAAGDEGEVEVPEGTAAILYAQMLVDLRDAGFPEDPDDPDGSKLGRQH